ncbi:MAG: PEP-CTERM sorting domain-containing protein [Pirellulaceae bacterium]|nr:PEP-CTERM sorting domain-containing protein [Pirellulaceae bacterium]
MANGAYVFANYGTLTGEPAPTVGLLPNMSVDYYYNAGSSIALVVVPEPSTLALLAGLFALLAGYRTRR